MSFQYSSDIVYHLKKVIANNLVSNIFINIKKNCLTKEDIRLIKNLINLCIKKNVQLMFYGSENTINQIGKQV